METLFVPLALFAGALLAVQAGANAQLSKAVGGAFGATVIQLSIGAALLATVAAATGGLAALGGLSAAPWWHAVGGTASAFYVVSTILLFPRLGAVVTVGLFIAGQMTASLALDAFGLLGVPERAPAMAMIGGAVAALAGAAMIVAGQDRGAASARSAGWLALALLAGAVLPAQGAVNALLKHDIGAPFAVGAVSFFIATLSMTLALGLAILLSAAGRPRFDGVGAMPWWGWLGGFAGAAYVTTVFSAIPSIGAAATVGLTVAGQQVASVFVDRHGWLRLPQRPVTGLRLAGVCVILLGVAAITFGRQN